MGRQLCVATQAPLLGAFTVLIPSFPGPWHGPEGSDTLASHEIKQLTQVLCTWLLVLHLQSGRKDGLIVSIPLYITLLTGITPVL